MYNNFNMNVVSILKNMESERNNLHHPFVGSEHLLLSLLKNDIVTQKVFNKYKLNYDVFKKELINLVGMPKKNVEYNLYTPLLKRVLNNAVEDAKENNDGIVTINHLILSLLEEGEGVAIRILVSYKIDINTLYDDIKNNKNKKMKKIDFGKNLNNTVSLDEKTIGRDKEINFIIETLLRKKKSNPLLIGDAGVGKTAVVEELARKIINKEVPSELINAEIISLDMSNLVAGTKYRGEFEEKLNKIIKIVEQNNNIILFIDEIHTMVSAGGAEGAISAGDIFKPYLARGNIKCIGATTTDEYDKYILKDKALARRFETININEPSKDETINILMKIKSEYEQHHKVKISKKNIIKIVDYSDKYIFNKKNPDKSIDFLDSVCTMKHVKSDNSIEVNKLLNKLEKIKIQKESMVSNNKFDDAIRLRNKEIKLENNIKNISFGKYNIICDKDILKVLEQKANVPLYNKNTICKVKNNLQSIIGQDEQIKKINSLINYKINNVDQLLSMLFIGPSGVGKSEVVKILNKSIDKINYIKINGSEYSCETSLNKLVGITAGYVGYNDSYIFNKLRYNPYALIVIENFDLLANNIKNMFYQILEEGYIIDSRGNHINFNSSIIISTITSDYKNKIGFNNKNDNNFYSNYVDKFSDVIYFNNITKDVFLDYVLRNKLSKDIINICDYQKSGFKNLKKEIIKINT